MLILCCFFKQIQSRNNRGNIFKTVKREAEFRGFLNHINTYDRNLQFTLEVEIENKLPYLDVLIIPKAHKTGFYYLSKANTKQ